MGWIGVKKLKQVGPPEKAIEQGREIPKALQRQELTRAARSTSAAHSSLGVDCSVVARLLPSSAASRTWSAVSA